MKPGLLFGAILLCFLAPRWAGGISLEQLTGSERAERLRRGEMITATQFTAPQPVLLPRHGFTGEVIAGALGELEPGFLVECLSLYVKPRHAASDRWSEAERSALYNRTIALSTLTGIQYFSTSRGRMRTFYESSMVIDGPDTRNPRPDPVYRNPPPELSLYARQKDLTFGDTIYRYTCYARPDALISVQENDTPLRISILPAVGKRNLRSTLAVIDAGPYLLIYVSSMAKAASVPGMNQRVGASFSTRAEAIIKWFSSQADTALAP